MEFSTVGNTEKISEKNSSRDSKLKNSSHDSKQHLIALKNAKDEEGYILPQQVSMISIESVSNIGDPKFETESSFILPRLTPEKTQVISKDA